MELSTEGGRLIPEQVWDADDIPALELFRGKPTGSACPLVWAHSEYIKLRRSLRDGKIFDQPPQTVQRYQVERKKSAYFEWRFNNKCRTMSAGKEAAPDVACAGHGALELRWLADRAGYERRAIRWESSSQTCLPTHWRWAARSFSPCIGRRKQRWEGVNYTSW